MEWWVPLVYGGLGALTFGIGAIFGGTLVAGGSRMVLRTFSNDEETQDKETSNDAS